VSDTISDISVRWRIKDKEEDDEDNNYDTAHVNKNNIGLLP
jgi:hypothetical protein